MIWVGLFTLVNILPLTSATCPYPNIKKSGVGITSRKGSLVAYYPARYRVGAVLHFSCGSHSRLSSPTNITCQESGNWDYQGIISCDYVSCKALPNLQNGRITYSTEQRSDGRYVVYTVATYKCNSGYSLSGSQSNACQDSENWREDNPSCNTAPTPAPTSAPSGGPGCFPSTARVTLENGKSVTMSELQIGDKVQTVLSNGTVIYSEVRTFLKKQPDKMIECKSIRTVNETIILTGNHLLYSREKFAVKFNPVYADQLSIGDEVLVQGNNELIPVKVNNVSSIVMQGVYVPLTTNGKIMVDGILTSCYADFDHDLAHLTITPIQKFAEVMEWIFGNDLGFSVYVGSARQLGQLMLPEGQYLSY